MALATRLSLSRLLQEAQPTETKTQYRPDPPEARSAVPVKEAKQSRIPVELITSPSSKLISAETRENETA